MSSKNWTVPHRLINHPPPHTHKCSFNLKVSLKKKKKRIQVRLCASIAGSMGLIPGQGTKIPHDAQSVQLLSRVWLFAMPWTAARQASLSITNSQSLLKLRSIDSVMPSNHLILCHSLLLPPLIFPSIKGFSSESVLHIRWPKYLLFSRSVVSDSLQPHRLQHTRLPYSSPSPGAYSNSGPLSWVMPSNYLILCHPLLLLPSSL